MDIKGIKRRIKAINKTMLQVRDRICESIRARQIEREERLWSVMNSLMIQRKKLVRIYIDSRENKSC